MISGVIPAQYRPTSLDLRACNLGNNPGGVNLLREALGTKTASAGTCYIAQVPWDPVELSDPDGGDPVKITSESQLKDSADREAFDQGFDQLFDFVKNWEGMDMSPCLLGLGGSTPSRELIRKLYFKRGGHLMAAFYTPESDHRWNPDRSTCFESATRETHKASTLAGKLFKEDQGKCKAVVIKG